MTSSNLDKVKGLVNRVNLAKKEDSVIVDEFAKKIIDKVFAELSVIFPAWKNAWPTEKEMSMAKLQWTKAFVENDISTIEQISYGFAKARRSKTDFLPSCGKFISWCEPTPEDMGFPSEQQAMKECVKHKANQKMFVPQNIYIRPFIIELCKRVDWWLINNAGNRDEHIKAEKHFREEYLGLIKSGYKEPVETDCHRLETSDIVKNRMSDEQRMASKERAMSHIKNVKKTLNKASLNKGN